MNAAGRGRVVGIVDYQAGNIQSIENAFDHQGARVVRVQSAADLGGCSHLVLPGVGSFGFCAEKLRATALVDRVREWALEEQKPLLGICVGMQLLADASEESPDAPGLGWLGGQVRRIPASPGIRVPHVGWNTVEFASTCGEYAAGSRGDFYFDHSFAHEGPREGETVGFCQHGVRFSAVLRRGSVTAVQFHPEKSQAAGMKLLRGFLAQ
jgi:glutamine amidotransferase